MPNPNTATQSNLKTPNAATAVEVTAADLPLHCPMHGSSLWNSHPRVYVPLDENGKGKCPYCGTEYTLKG